MANQPRTNQLTHQRSQIRRNGIHAIAEVLGELGAVFGDGYDLVAEDVDVRNVGVGDFGAH